MATEMSDVVSAAILCESDSTIMLLVDNFEHWIPSVKVPVGQSWERTIVKEMTEVSFNLKFF